MAKLIEIQAEYQGTPVMIYESLKQTDIKVTAIYDDSSYNFIIPSSKITTSMMRVETIPTQVCVVKYIDPDTKIPYTATIEIPVLYPTKLTATYTGDYIYIISDFDHNDVDVYIEYNYPAYNSKLDATQYKISQYDVTKLGPNKFTVTEKVTKSNNLSTTITVYGIRKTVVVRASYIGEPVEITKEVNPNDIRVEIETVNEFNEERFTVDLKYGTEILQVGSDEFTCDFYIKEPLTITSAESNSKTICYKDPLTQWEKTISIPGTPKIVDFKTTYTGAKVHEGAIIKSEDVEATITFLTDITNDTKTTQILTYGEWDFYDAPIVQDFTKGMIKTQYRDLLSYIVVPYEVVETLRLRCWYEGAKIEVGKRFSREDVVVYTVDEQQRVVRLTQYDLIFVDNQIVTNNGWNFYKVQTKDSNISGMYAVPGFISLHKSDKKDFRVVYVDTSDSYTEHDCTDIFQKAMTLDDYLYISWDIFYDTVKEIKQYGVYVLTAPRLHGLSDKYDEDWEVLCTHKNALKATIIKTYNEEDETWQDRRQQQALQNWWKIPPQQTQ